METVLPKNNEVDRERALRRVIGYLTGLPLTKSFKVEVVEKKPRRSDQQNRYLFGVVYAKILEHLDGFDREDVHEMMLGEFGGWEVLEAFGKKRQRPLLRSSTMNKQTFADFIAFIQRYMAEKGIYIPDPNEDADNN